MLGYRIKQTAFMIAGLVSFFFTWERTVQIVLGRRASDLEGNAVFVELVWLVVCIGCGGVIARMTGGMNDAKG